jgi:hypothetical protein
VDACRVAGVGEAPVELHGPISTGPAGNRVYFGYGTNKDGIVQIVDRQKLEETVCECYQVVKDEFDRLLR